MLDQEEMIKQVITNEVMKTAKAEEERVDAKIRAIDNLDKPERETRGKRKKQLANGPWAVGRGAAGRAATPPARRARWRAAGGRRPGCWSWNRGRGCPLIAQ